MDKEKIGRKILEVVQEMCDKDLVAGTAGNVSLFDRENGIVWITPSSLPYKMMTSEDLIAITLTGEIKSGRHRPSSEWPLHTEIYKAYPEVNAVVHTHAPYATSFAVSNMEIPFILIEMCGTIGGSVPVAKFAIPGTREVGLEAVSALQGKTGCLLQNHGAVTVGSTLEQAFNRMMYVEDAAKVCHLAKLNGNSGVIPEKYQQIMLDRKNGGKNAAS